MFETARDGPALNVLLVSTYDLGRQPFGVASAAAWLRQAGAEVNCVDVTVDCAPSDIRRGSGAAAKERHADRNSP